MLKWFFFQFSSVSAFSNQILWRFCGFVISVEVMPFVVLCFQQQWVLQLGKVMLFISSVTVIKFTFLFPLLFSFIISLHTYIHT